VADNVVANAGSGGATFATDDVGGVHYPVSKLAFGALDTATLVTPSVGLPVGDAGGSLTVDGTVAVSGTVTVDSELPAAAALADAASAAPTAPTLGAVPLLMNATTVDRARAVVNGLDSAGTGVQAAGMVGQLDDTATGAVTENQFAPVRISSRRALLVEGVAGATAVKIDGSAVTQPVSLASVPLPTGAATEATLATRLDAADFDSKAGALTETAPATDTASSGLNGRLQRIAQRLTSLIALVPGALVGGRFDVNLGAAPATVTVTGTVTASNAAGDVAHDGVDSGNPIKVGAQARTTDITPVANADRVNAIADTLGKTVVLIGAVNDLHVDGNGTFTTTAAADLIAAAGVGVRIAVTAVLVTNAHATVATKVEIRDGTTVKLQGQAAAAGGGFALSGGGHPLFISTANAAITGRCVTTGAAVDIFVSGYKIAN